VHNVVGNVLMSRTELDDETGIRTPRRGSINKMTRDAEDAVQIRFLWSPSSHGC
jgi:hypothetical protein